jgi:hypothetical protein
MQTATETTVTPSRPHCQDAEPSSKERAIPYLIRVRLADQPGALGRLATALGAVGADIETVAIVDRAGGEAVDDLVVALPRPALAETLVTAVLSVDGVVLESIQPHAGRARVTDELALLDAAAVAPNPLDVLVRGLPDLLAVRYALAVDVRMPGHVAVATTGAPEQPARVDWMPLPRARELAAGELYDDPDAAGPDAMLVAAPVSPRVALVVARNGGATFRPAEVLRLAHLAHLIGRTTQGDIGA